MPGSRDVFFPQLVDQIVRNRRTPMRKRRETMRRPRRGLCSGAMLAGQRLTGQFGQHVADGAPLPLSSFLHSAQNIIIDRQCMPRLCLRGDQGSCLRLAPGLEPTVREVDLAAADEHRDLARILDGVGFAL